MSDAPRKVFERLVAAQNAHDIEALVAYVAQDSSSEQPAHPHRAFEGNAQVRKNRSSIFASVPDFHAEPLAAAVEGETVWGEFEWRGRRRIRPPLTRNRHRYRARG